MKLSQQMIKFDSTIVIECDNFSFLLISSAIVFSKN